MYIYIYIETQKAETLGAITINNNASVILATTLFPQQFLYVERSTMFLG